MTYARLPAVAAILGMLLGFCGPAAAPSRAQELHCAAPQSQDEADRCVHRNDTPPAPAPAARPASANPQGAQPAAQPNPSGETVQFNAATEAQKRKAREATGYRDPGAVALCPPPNRMTEKDGCQPPR